MVNRNERPLAALEAAAQQEYLVLLGDPGSGKSIFVNHLTYLLIQAQREPATPPNALKIWPLSSVVLTCARWARLEDISESIGTDR